MRSEFAIVTKAFFFFFLTGSSWESNKSRRIDSPAHDEQFVCQTSLNRNSEMKADDASGNQIEVSTMEGHRSQNNRKRKISGSSYDPGMA